MATTRDLLARYQRGEVLTWAERLQCCPHRAVVNAGGMILAPAEDAGVSGGCFIIGSEPDTFTEAMRAWVVAALREDHAILVAASDQRVFNRALNEIAMEMMPSAGRA